MASQPQRTYISVEEYLEREETGLDRHEYWNGQIFVMAGGSDEHADICANVLASLWLRLKGTRCKVRGSDMRLRTRPSGLYSYADAVVCCADAKVEQNTLLNPVVIVEVQSPATADYDRGKKFQEYRQLPSFQEYLIIAQDQPYIEHHVRGDQVWTMREYGNINDSILLNVIGVQLPIAEVYMGIEFPPPATLT